VALLLADARKKEEKRTAKRVANRKSACTSRARKKALVEEMTKANARLRRQAMILALLPDMVVAITEDGEITFCSAQVERVLRHPVTELVGAKLTDILVPSSREALGRLTSDLIATANSKEGDASNKGEETTERRPINEIANKAEGEESGGDNSSSGAAVVSDMSFPPSVVKVQNNRTQLQGQGESTSDVSNSGDNTASAPEMETKRNATVGVEVSNKKEGISKDLAPKKAAHPQTTSSDDSLSLSSDAKNIRKASESLNLNVRLHNAKLMCNTQQSGPASHTDDVTGQSVTANNADARLSSLQHHPSAGGKVPTGLDSTASEEAKNTNTKAAGQPNGNGMVFECGRENSSSSSTSFLASVEEQKKKAQRRQAENMNENLSEDSGYREESGESPSSPEDSASLASDTSSSSRNGRFCLYNIGDIFCTCMMIFD
jgi:PAS domain-containing protein